MLFLKLWPFQSIFVQKDKIYKEVVLFLVVNIKSKVVINSKSLSNIKKSKYLLTNRLIFNDISSFYS